MLRWCERPASAGTPDPLADAIALRHTNRRFYARARVDAATLASPGHAAGAVAGRSVYWLDAIDERRRALRAIRLAETERFRRRALHDELFGAVRFDVGWKHALPEGLAPGALEVEPPVARLMFSAMRKLASDANGEQCQRTRDSWLSGRLSALRVGAAPRSAAGAGRRKYGSVRCRWGVAAPVVGRSRRGAGIAADDGRDRAGTPAPGG